MPEKSDLRQRMTISRYPYDQTGRRWIFNSDENLKKLPDIDKTIKALARLPLEKRNLHDDFYQKGTFYASDEPRFSIKENSRLQQLRNIIGILLRLHQINEPLSHHAHALLEHFSWCCFDLPKDPHFFPRKEAIKISVQITESIEGLKKRIQSKEFKDKEKHVNTITRQRKKNLTAWINKAFRQTPELLFIHLHVGLLDPHHRNLELACHARKTFLSYRQKNPIFLYLIGYIFKVNYHAEKGIVQDILLFYDARKIREAVSLTADLEKLWQNTTYDQNEGKYYGIIWSESKRLHLSFKSHETPLIPQDQCVLRRDNKDDKKTINRLIRHLSSYDTYISYHTTSKTRMLGKSVIHNRKKKTVAQKKKARTSPAVFHVPY